MITLLHALIRDKSTGGTLGKQGMSVPSSANLMISALHKWRIAPRYYSPSAACWKIQGGTYHHFKKLSTVVLEKDR